MVVDDYRAGQWRLFKVAQQFLLAKCPRSIAAPSGRAPRPTGCAASRTCWRWSSSAAPVRKAASASASASAARRHVPSAASNAWLVVAGMLSASVSSSPARAIAKLTVAFVSPVRLARSRRSAACWVARFHSTPPRPAAENTTSVRSAATTGLRRTHFAAQFRTPYRSGQDRLVGQIVLQVRRQPFGAAVAFLRLLPQAFQADHFEVAPHLGVEAGRRHRLVAHDLNERIERVLGLKWRPPGQQFVKHGSQPVHVGRRAQSPFRFRLLRRHVGRRAHNRSRRRRTGTGLHALGQAEVGHVRRRLVVKQDVRRLEVAVQDAALVGVVDRPRYRYHQAGRRAWVGHVGVEVPRGCRPPSVSSRRTAGRRARRPRRWARCLGVPARRRSRPRCGSGAPPRRTPAGPPGSSSRRQRAPGSLAAPVDDAHAAAGHFRQHRVVSEGPQPRRPWHRGQRVDRHRLGGWGSPLRPGKPWYRPAGLETSGHRSRPVHDSVRPGTLRAARSTRRRATPVRAATPGALVPPSRRGSLRSSAGKCPSNYSQNGCTPARSGAPTAGAREPVSRRDGPFMTRYPFSRGCESVAASS